MIPTLLGIMTVTFVIVQFAPGGPVERMIAKASGFEAAATQTVSGGAEMGLEERGGAEVSRYRGAQGLDPEFVEKIVKEFGFDKPAHERFLLMLGNYARLDFGESYYKSVSVVDLVAEKLPVSISLGLWSTLLAYLISIPLGVRKAVKDGSRFDVWSSAVVVVGYAVPGFLFAVILIVLFAGGTFFDIFPLRGLSSDNAASLGFFARILDYFWHLILPLTALAIGSFATLTLLTKNSFLEEINKQYVVTARAKGLTEHRVLYGHVFRNGILVVVAGFPGAFMGVFFTGSILIETIFSLDGLGLLSFESIVNRDYPVVFGSLFIFSILGMVVSLIADLSYTWLDPRIDFEAREA